MTEENKLLANATITLEGKNHSLKKETGSDGKVSFDEVPPDTYTLLITKEGYKEYLHPTPLEIQKDKLSNYDLKINLEKIIEEETRKLIIKLSHEVQDVTLKLYQDEVLIQYANTDETGTATFEEVPYGSYSIKANIEEYEEVSKNITVNSTNKNPRTISISLVSIQTTEEEDTE
ncbi:SpaA isopeptide-forming pilin-related protein [Methanosphaera sp.]